MWQEHLILRMHMSHSAYELPDFALSARAPFSDFFRENGMDSFRDSARWVCELPYGRHNLQGDRRVLEEGCGTCSSKHSLLKTLADENDWQEIHLYVGLVSLDPTTNDEVAKILRDAQLTMIPEAHCFLKYGENYFDFTSPSFHVKQHLLGTYVQNEVQIEPVQTGAWKVAWHQRQMLEWLEQENIDMTLEQLWEWREKCIAVLR